MLYSEQPLADNIHNIFNICHYDCEGPKEFISGLSLP